MVLLVRFAQYNAFLYFILGDTEAAERWNATAESVIFASGTDFPVADHYLVQCLLCVDRLKDPTTEDRPAIEAKLIAAHAKLAKQASHCPENFAHKHRLVSAELSALRGEPLETTLGLYREALGSIGEGDFTQLVALINERQGAFWIARGEHTVGRAFLREARYHYARWGAFRKVDAMEAKYREHFAFFGQTERDGGITRTKGRTHRTSNALSNAMLDITSITKSTQSISGEIRIGNLLRTLLQTIVENAGAQSGCFLLANEAAPRLHVAALKEASSDTIEILAPSLHHYGDKACPEIVEYVERTRESLVLDDASAKGRFAGNEYIRSRKVKSVLCMPVLRRNALKGIVYLENNLADHAFTTDRLSILAILASQASISIENAQLYEDMEGKVRERTKQLNEANERLKQLTLIDPLTHLNNRRFFHDYIAGAAESYIRRLNRTRSGTEKRAVQSESLMGVYLIDIDHFKSVNDTWGHAAGDGVLVGISKVLKSIIRSDDFIVRWGGEEFLVILNNTSPLFLDRFARKVLKAVRETLIPLPGHPDIVKTCSVGYTQIPFTDSSPDFLTLEQTIKLSDYALYVAKQHGRNRAVRIGIKPGQVPDGVLKDCLVSLSQNSPNDVEGIELTHIREDG
jgi:diguanylate cyclase (GGDEF)-like protein